MCRFVAKSIWPASTSVVQHHLLDDSLGRMVRASAMPSRRTDHRPVTLKELLPRQRVGPVAHPFQQRWPRFTVHESIFVKNQEYLKNAGPIADRRRMSS
jgi:hypothetical protein